MENRVLRGMLVFCLLCGVAWAADEPLAGKWKLIPAKSKMTDVMKVKALGANKYALTFSGDNVETITVDGSDQPGMFGTTLAISVEGPNNWKVVRKMQGRTTISANWTLSEDGSSLTDHFTGFRPDGTVNKLDYVYKRAEGGSGFSGTWESVSEQVNSKYELQVDGDGGEGMSLIFTPQQVTKKLKFDDKDYPNEGPNVPAGMVSSAHRINGQGVAITDKVASKVIDTQEIELSADHMTLTVTVHPAGRKTPNVLVFERE